MISAVPSAPPVHFPGTWITTFSQSGVQTFPVFKYSPNIYPSIYKDDKNADLLSGFPNNFKRRQRTVPCLLQKQPPGVMTMAACHLPPKRQFLNLPPVFPARPFSKRG